MPTPASDLDLVDGLFQLAFHLFGVLSRIGAEHELSIIQIRLLGMLRDREPGMLDLARRLKLEKSSLSGLVDRAAQRGLVERVPSPDDGRAAHVRMTARGRALARKIEGEVTAEVVRLASVLSKADQSRLAALASRLVANAS